MEEVILYIEYVAKFMESLGVGIIAIGSVLALIRFIKAQFFHQHKSYTRLRQELGKAILLGLEVLVAADIIATVVTEPTLEKVFTLGVIVLIRTFLSLSLQVEIEGSFPWNQKGQESSSSERKI